MARVSSRIHQLAMTDRYVEYDASGRVIKGEEAKAHSRYDEDVYINNHTAVWGSFWRDGAWGYACCCSTVKQSYCVGQAGVQAEKAQARCHGRPVKPLCVATTGREHDVPCSEHPDLLNLILTWLSG